MLNFCQITNRIYYAVAIPQSFPLQGYSNYYVYKDSIIGKYDIYKNLAVTDSNHVICSDNDGATIWNLTTKKIENKIKVFERAGVYINPVSIKLSDRKDKLLLAQNDTVRLVDLLSHKDSANLFYWSRVGK